MNYMKSNWFKVSKRAQYDKIKNRDTGNSDG
jgi:hypothetical protein